MTLNYYPGSSSVVFTNVQIRATRPHIHLPSALIHRRSLHTVHVANTPFLTQPPNPISVTTRSFFARHVQTRFQRVCRCAGSHSKHVHIPAARHAILVHVLRVRSHLSGHVVVGQQHVPSPAVQRRLRQTQLLSSATSHVARCALAVIINVLVYAAH